MGSERRLIGPRVDARRVKVGNGWSFLLRFFRWVAVPPYHPLEVLQQCYEIGVRSVGLVMLTGFITGIVFTQQSRPSLASFGATSWLPSLITIALVRSLAPLVTALVCAGKVGSSIGAELGSMKVTDQIEAMEVSAINPFKFLVVTRTVASTLMIPVLTAYFGVVAFLGAYLNVKANEGTTMVAFVRSGFSTIDLLDVGSALVRSVFFGFIIGLIACHAGFTASRGTQGVGQAANGAVVRSMLAVFIGEIVIVQLIALLRSF